MKEVDVGSRVVPVVLAGGVGSRLWPLSRESFPKQFLNLVNPERSMLQETLSRLEGLPVAEPLVICNNEHRFLAAEQLRNKVKLSGNLLLEPCGRNTAPAIALAAWHELSLGNDPILLVLPADHLITDLESFHERVIQALDLATQNGLVTLGIVPSHPETGYGYIEKGAAGSSGFKVSRFVEKPDDKTAQRFFDSKQFLWNSGMFVFKASVYLDELNKHRPKIYEASRRAAKTISPDLDFLRVDESAFADCPAESIDYAVMEQTDNAFVIPLDAGWSDIGSWQSLWQTLEKDTNGNVHRGDVVAKNSHNNFVFCESGLVATLGLKDCIIVQTKDAVLVANKDNVQEVKAVVEELSVAGRSEHKLHREVFRPWGKYDLVDVGNTFQVKKITVNVEQKLSLQKHAYRSEHWVVVSGQARVTLNDDIFMLSKNESIYIPVGAIHALENTGKEPLELIEVQSGDYLGEDDIIRFEDRYGRV
jgi:mannose-1-phosphate guanylyltransferase